MKRLKEEKVRQKKKRQLQCPIGRIEKKKAAKT